MKIIFLDIDGVVTNLKTGWRLPDLDCLHELFRIIKETGAFVVLSSTWRLHVDLFSQVQSWGINFISMTPRCHQINVENEVRWTERGDEIQEWLDMHEHLKIESFVILDDDQDMKHLSDRLVITSWGDGLSKEDADRAIEILNG